MRCTIWSYYPLCMPESLETLPDWTEIETKNGPLWFTTHFYAKRLERATKALVKNA
jgi:hypothetical protein